MTIQTYTVLYVLLRYRKIRTRKLCQHGDIRHVPINSKESDSC
jgi:hypothetical protein